MRFLLCFFIIIFGSESTFSQRHVVVEKFTNAYCGACAGAAVTLKNIVDDHPDVIWLSHHKPISWIDNGLTNEESIGLWNELEVLGTPMGMVNRVEQNGQLLMGSSQWKAAVVSEEAKSQQVAIALNDFSFDENNRSVSFEIAVEILSDLEEADYQLNIVMVEDSVWGVEQHSYFNDVAGHPLEGLGDVIWGYPHRNVVRHIFDNRWGTDDVFSEDLIAGTVVTQNYSYDIPFTSRLSTYQVVAFVSKYDEAFADLTIIDANRFRLSDYGITLGLSEDIIDSELTLTIEPNPITTQLTIKTAKLAKQFIIIDSHGKAVYQFTPSGSVDSYDVSGLSSGRYTLLAIHEVGIASQSFVVQK